ncbi:GNAT family N-acetyltransferase [Rhodococcoides yunnanense]|uniref:GNAT family N-acetyltransferase n=1 Tax=Rhodococcoides yunnanense TaxID=278209 RepID=UPI000934B2A2|nr:GNAT family N-acetyltransferase [Rhodococcus yunnanensis]
MDSHHHDIVRLAWSRHLGLADTALRSGTRHSFEHPNATKITFVRLGDASALVGPQWALDAARERTDDDLAERGVLAELDPARSGRVRGPIVLSYAGDVGSALDHHDPLISHELAHARALEASCAPDDVIAAELTQKHSWFTLMGDEQPAESASPLAGAAYIEWEGLLADVGVLTAPEARRHGYGQVVARLATNDAIDEGLIPQWRSDTQNGVARRLASRLGYEEWGEVTSVELARP